MGSQSASVKQTKSERLAATPALRAAAAPAGRGLTYDAGAQFLGDGDRAVARAVVDDDDLVRSVGALICQGRKRRSDRGLRVARGHDYGDGVCHARDDNLPKPMAVRNRTISSSRWHFLVNVLAASPLLSPLTRTRVLRRCGIRSESTDLQPSCRFASARVSIGERVFVNHRCCFEACHDIVIGDDCSLAQEVRLIAIDGPIEIGAGTWLGARVTVRVGRHDWHRLRDRSGSDRDRGLCA